MNEQFPKMTNVPTTETKFINHVPHVDKAKFKRAVVQFFKFYSTQYQMKNHIISVNIGRWKNRILESKQTNNTSEEKKFVTLHCYIESYTRIAHALHYKNTHFPFFPVRLKAGIELNPHKWKNCMMCVQDVITPEINIAAEISEEEANHFKHMCKIFASESLHDQTINEYFAKISQERSTFINSTLEKNVLLTVIPVSEFCETLIPLPKSTDAHTNTNPLAMSSPDTNLISGTNVGTNLKPNAMKKLENVIKVDMITKHSKIEMNEILLRSKSRIKYEQNIIKILSFFVTTYDATIKLRPFDSFTYGFGGSDFNILVSSGKIDLLIALVN